MKVKKEQGNESLSITDDMSISCFTRRHFMGAAAGLALVASLFISLAQGATQMNTQLTNPLQTCLVYYRC